MSAVRTLRYVAIGDSLSEGVGDLPWPDGTPRGWADRLAQVLADHHGGLDYANLAIRGHRTVEVLATQAQPALALDPDIVTLTAGMNDILRPRLDVAALRQRLVDIVAPFTAKGVRVAVVPIPDLRGVTPAGRLLQRRRLLLNELYDGLAQEHEMIPPTVTTGTVFEDRRAWAEDRLHLSELGHTRLAVAAAELMGVPATTDWAGLPDGPPPRRTVRTEVAWTREYVWPWTWRRLRGRSTGDGRTAKHPDLVRQRSRGPGRMVES
ncbi:SGNH/GDSL hydrolase family protein [Janibacter cremeus]|uniref:Lysophospholipase L1-like esterase n=1 Tax=Janibacter cremeus TaxID=1285192 RepID=A0A852VRB4_9MICO|nr:SGNH/GDSL hydrolase family protein [Janibacter cremeus]NYF96864.1 lysophospholipase L1-like esterase [Janibacter cremeus]